MTDSCRIHLISGTRPNVMKVAPLFKVLDGQGWADPAVVFLGQHYSPNMSEDIFHKLGVDELEYVRPLEERSFGLRLGEIIEKYSMLLEQDPPDIVIVPGDVDVTVGAAIAAKRMKHYLVHLEAGLRSYDVDMPEEQNRKLVDSISDFLLAPSEDAYQNLIYHEGHSHQKVAFVGNIMIDALTQTLDPDHGAELLTRYGLTADGFALVTLHRPANVDDPVRLEAVCRLLVELSRRHPLLLPVHPRTARKLNESGIGDLLAREAITRTDALPYPDFVNLLAASRFVLTDSGGIQEEAAFLKIPCFTLRESTERPITVVVGANTLVSEHDVLEQIERNIGDAGRAISDIPLWDGRTAERCAHILRNNWRQFQLPQEFRERTAV